MEGVNYPYLGKKSYKDHEYVVMFTEENYGVVVMSDIEDVDELKFGKMGDFNETMFELLPKGMCVRLEN